MTSINHGYQLPPDSLVTAKKVKFQVGFICKVAVIKRVFNLMTDDPVKWHVGHRTKHDLEECNSIRWYVVCTNEINTHVKQVLD